MQTHSVMGGVSCTVMYRVSDTRTHRRAGSRRPSDHGDTNTSPSWKRSAPGCISGRVHSSQTRSECSSYRSWRTVRWRLSSQAHAKVSQREGSSEWVQAKTCIILECAAKSRLGVKSLESCSAQAVVDSIIWRFRRLKKPTSREMSAPQQRVS